MTSKFFFSPHFLHRFFFFGSIAALLSTSSGSGCAGKKIFIHPSSFQESNHPRTAEKLWSLKLPGLITDLNVSQSGNRVLISTIPDPDEEGSPKMYQTFMYNGIEGNQLWKNSSTIATRSQALSKDGSFAVISNYNEELIGLNDQGKTLWTAEGTCKPTLLNQARKIICYHDDDAEPHIAFDIFDWNGKKIHSFPIKSDILNLKISDDEKNLALSLTHGTVILIASDFKKTLWNKKISNEIIDLDVGSGASPQVAVLHANPKNQKITLFDSHGKTIHEEKTTAHMDQLDFSQTGKALFAYGNSSEGQHLSYYPLPLFKEKWHRMGSRFADYAPPLNVSSDFVLMGFEDVEPGSRHSHVLLFDYEGKLMTDITLQTEEGAYLYTQSLSPENSVLFLGTDDSTLTAYKITPKQNH